MTLRVGAIALCLTLAAGAQDGKIFHTVRFRTEPRLGVTVLVDSEPHQVTENIALDYSKVDSKLVEFRREGFVTEQRSLSSQEASLGVYPAEEKAPVALRASNPLVGWSVWAQEHPLSALLALALGGLALPAVAYRAWVSLTRQRELRSRLHQLDEKRDRSDSLLMTRVENYLLVNLLGHGGMATVYRGVPADTMDERGAVAIKILSRQLFNEPEFWRRFQREVQAYQKLTHPNIVRVFSWREMDGSGDSPYIILELVSGTTLGCAIPSGGMSWEEARPLLAQVFDAVAFAHRHGVVHRDLKPDNIMVDQGRVKVMDFGLARSHDASQLTATGTVLGTPAYMAPEQLSDGSSAPGVDQYALGAVTYKVLSGRLPHEAQDMMQLFSKVLAGAPVPLATYRPDLPKHIEEAVMRMLAREPGRRFPSVQEAWSAFEQ